MKQRAMLAVGSLLLFGASGDGCGGGVSGGDPTIELLTPEPGTRARQTLAISGTTTGGVKRVVVEIDETTLHVASGTKEWTLILDIAEAGLADGSHVLLARAEGRGDNQAETPLISFITVHDSAEDSVLLAGFVRDPDGTPIPGANVALYADPLQSTVADLTGRYALTNLVRNTDLVLCGTAASFMQTCMFEINPNGDNTDFNIALFDDESLDFIADAFGVTRQNGLATAVGFLLDTEDDTFEGGTVSVVPPPPAGTFYTGPGGEFDAQYTSTTAGGGFWAFNVPVGPITFTATSGSAAFITVGSRGVADGLAVMIGIETEIAP